MWNSPEGGWKGKRAATPGRQVRRMAEEKVNVKKDFQLIAGNKCYLHE